ncbi:cobalt-precorrin-6A reductase [Halorhodospira halochloris]|uniref:cobalt-precorrin-6A reductase n=1 Tax=Halorhodospira halochloris TaxID=1052 RepID=UPI001EE8B7E5|nr:cobalt-precorrin-6A reductase [Halorhodospira halochloris]MCG5529890.1 cobalt-precorrin-6A reductase [Halorhodospira halochloris]
MSSVNVLILGGTTEAMQLARLLEGDARFQAVYSVAGRTSNPRLPNLICRSGGFGGVEGLRDWLAANQCRIIVDATHPFAGQISHNAARAAKLSGASLLAVSRPPWRAVAGDCWQSVTSMAEAARALGDAPKRVLLTIGKLELAAFCRAPQHYYVSRSVDLPEQHPPHCECITQRGPFRLEDELALLDDYSIEVMVTKNSGGSAAQPKLEAARRRRVPVVMVERPPLPGVAEQVQDAEQALRWLERYA